MRCCHGVRWAELSPRHGATLVNEGVVTYVRGGESPARQIRDPVTELIVTRRDGVRRDELSSSSRRNPGK